MVDGFAWCTANFVFQNGSTYGLGTAGHCGAAGALASPVTAVVTPPPEVCANGGSCAPGLYAIGTFSTVRNGGRVTASRAFDNLDAQPIGPNRELLDGRRAERVARTEDDLLALRAKHLRQLGDRRCLARAVDANDENHRWPARRQLNRLLRLLQNLANLVFDAGQHIIHVHDASAKIGADAIANPRKYLSRLAVRSGERTIFLAVDDVERMEAAQNYVRVHTGQGTHLLHVPMNTLETSLDPEQFVRIHRSHIVNLRRIKQLWTFGHGQYVVELASGERVQSGRTYVEKIRTLLANPF